MPDFLDVLAENADAGIQTICPKKALNRPVFEGGTVEGDVGLELEIEGYALPGTAAVAHIQTDAGVAWNVIADGSLRNGGREFVTTGVLKTNQLRKMVGGLFEYFEQTGTRIANTNRCSTHVHVNASGLKANQVTSVLALWATFESFFIRWCGEERVSNHFCLSTKDEEGTMEAWRTYLETSLLPARGGRAGIKYTALNILPLWTLGSLEFRCGSAPDEPDKVIYWAKICNAIVRYAAETYKNPFNLSYAMSEQGPERILREVLEYANLGPMTTDKIYAELLAFSDNFTEEAMAAFREAQDLIHLFDWDRAMDEIEKVYVPSPFAKRKAAQKRMHELRANIDDLNWPEPVAE